MGPRMGVACGREGAWRGPAQGRNSVGLRMVVAVWGCAGAQRGAANGAQREAA